MIILHVPLFASPIIGRRCIAAREHVHTYVAGHVQTERLSANKSHCAEANLAMIATSYDCKKAARDLGYDYGGDATPPYTQAGGCSYRIRDKKVFFSKNFEAHGCRYNQVTCLCNRGVYTVYAPHVRLVVLAIRGCSRSYPSNSHSHPVCTAIQTSPFSEPSSHIHNASKQLLSMGRKRSA